MSVIESVESFLVQWPAPYADKSLLVVIWPSLANLREYVVAESKFLSSFRFLMYCWYFLFLREYPLADRPSTSNTIPYPA
jgi:hypothetical protein